nr:sialidase family protein [Rhodoferax sp.]
MTINYRIFNWLLLVCLIQALSACSVVSPPKNVLAEISDADLTQSSLRPSVIEVGQGNPAVLYVNKAGRVAIKIGEETKIIDSTARVKVGASYTKLYKHGDGLQALWWSHSDGKNIYMTTSDDRGKSFTPVQTATSDNGVLLPFTLLPGSNPGVLGMVYTDERTPGYEVYANRSTDGGRTWNQVDMRLDTPPSGGRSSSAQEPIALKLSSGWAVVWSDTFHQDGKAVYRLLGTVSKDDGISWAEPKVIYTTDRFISSLVGSAENDTIVVAGDVLGRGVLAVVSNDAGAQWQTVGVAPGTEKTENSGLRVLQRNGFANLVWMKSADNAKIQIMHARLDTKTAAWMGEGAKRLDVKVYDNTKSMFPEIVAVDGGRLVSAWSDYREIVPNVYLSVSNDDGKTWQPATPMMDLAKEWPAGFARVLPWSNGIAIAQAQRDAFKFGNERFVVKHVTFEEMISAARQASVGARELVGESKVEGLRQRLDEFWSARTGANFDKTYGMFDPAYRALNSKEAYLESLGPITYLSYAIGDISVKGNEAKVKVTTKYEIKPTVLPSLSKPFQVAPTDVTAEITWVWIVDDWYQVYSSVLLNDQPLGY